MTNQTETDWTYHPYAGAGSPRTPEHILWVLKHLASKLARTGWTLRSGGGLGADAALADGVADAGPGMPTDPATRRRRVPPHEVYTANDVQALRQAPRDSEDYASFRALAAAAAAAHPDWEACDVPTRLRHTAGLLLLLGPYPLAAPVPVHFLVYWDDAPAGANGGGQLVRYAERWNRGDYGEQVRDIAWRIDPRNLADPPTLERALARIGIDPADFRAQWSLDEAYRASEPLGGTWPR